MMGALDGKQIVVGITGGIAAYKSAELVRVLTRQGAAVRVVMTPAAREFITPLTLQALSGNPVHESLLDPLAEAAMGHIELARWADLVIVAPASANFICRLAHGAGDDLLTTFCLATEAMIAIAPAMNQAMWRNALVQQNCQRLMETGGADRFRIWGPAEGIQACGDTGPGRMLEPDELGELAAGVFRPQVLAGKQVMITAGPTLEAIDPVRYITNHSSGKMGYALAAAAIGAGAKVTLISGPVYLQPPAGVEMIRVSAATEMLASVEAELPGCDILIGAAAVADYRPVAVSRQKIKKSASEFSLALTRNPDILGLVGSGKYAATPFLVGFAAETEQIRDNALKKIQKKQLDMIIANDVSAPGLGFNSDHNAVQVLWPGGEIDIPPATKEQVAEQLIDIIARRLPARITEHA